MTTTQNSRPFSRDQKRVEATYKSPTQAERDRLGLPPIKLAWVDPIKVNLAGVDSEESDGASMKFRRLTKKFSIQDNFRKK